MWILLGIFLVHHAGAQTIFDIYYEPCNVIDDMTVTCSNENGDANSFQIFKGGQPHIIGCTCLSGALPNCKVEKCAGDTMIIRIRNVSETENASWQCSAGGDDKIETVDNSAFPTDPDIMSDTNMISCTTCGPNGTMLNVDYIENSEIDIKTDISVGGSCNIPGWSGEYFEHNLIATVESSCGINGTIEMTCIVSSSLSECNSGLPSISMDMRTEFETTCSPEEQGGSSDCGAGCIAGSTVAGVGACCGIAAGGYFGSKFYKKKKNEKSANSSIATGMNGSTSNVKVELQNNNT